MNKRYIFALTLLSCSLVSCGEDDDSNLTLEEQCVKTMMSGVMWEGFNEYHWADCKGNCPDGSKRNGDNVCVCDEDNHWTGNAGSCECADGYSQSGDLCVRDDIKKCNANEVLKSDACVCDVDKHWTGNAGSCECAEGYSQSGDLCVNDDSKECNANEVLKDDACVCDEDNHWTGTAGNCECAEGYIADGNKCVTIDSTCDPDSEVYDEKQKACICDKDNHWTGTAGNCECVSGYKLVDNSCIEHGDECSFKQVLVNGKCVCNAELHFVDKGGACECEDGYLYVNKKCELDTECDSNRKVFNNAVGHCVCNADEFWTESGDDCACMDGYVKSGSKCVAQVICTGQGMVLNKDSNTCVCDTANKWTGDENGCECAFGYKLSGSNCVTYSKGDTFTFGTYYYEMNNVKKHIDWKVLDVEPDRYLLLSQDVLDAMAFNDDDSNNAWKSSKLETWLNGTFFDAAFSSDEQSKIPQESLSDVGTSDYVFVLNFDDVTQKYFKSNSDRRATATPYAVGKGVKVVDGRGLWWLRTANVNDGVKLVQGVRTDGDIALAGFHPHSNEVGVRPAIYVKY